MIIEAPIISLLEEVKNMEALYQDDQDFMKVLERNDRSELCAYRRYVLDEIKSREYGTKRQLVNIKVAEPRSKFWDLMQAIIFLSLTIASIFIVLLFAHTESVALIALFIALAVGSGATGATYIMDLQRTLNARTIIAQPYEKEAEDTHRSAISTDPDKILESKKAKLDQVLGFATSPQ